LPHRQRHRIFFCNVGTDRWKPNGGLNSGEQRSPINHPEPTLADIKAEASGKSHKAL